MAAREQTENEIKLLNADANNRLSYENDPNKTIGMLVKLLKGFGIEYGNISFKEQTDRYYDDDNGTLYKNRSGIRERRKDGVTEITLKTLSSSTKRNIGFQRTERERDLSENDDALEKMQSLLSDAGLNVVLNKNFAVEVRTLRHKIPIKADGAEFELCLDKIRFYKKGKESEPQYEIEIEVIDKEIESVKIQGLTEVLISEFGFIISEKIKFERAWEWTGTSNDPCPADDTNKK
jgi:inorganic triphosphatase YgiF